MSGEDDRSGGSSVAIGVLVVVLVLAALVVLAADALLGVVGRLAG